jgi:hypothetical protein
MGESSFLRGPTRRQVVLLGVLLVVGAIFIFFPDWDRGNVGIALGILGIAAGVFGLISTLLLKLGKVKPGSSSAGETVLGMLLSSIGLLGFGLDHLFAALEESAASGFRLPMILVEVLPFMILCLFVGLVIEWRAGKKRESRSEAID